MRKTLTLRNLPLILLLVTLIVLNLSLSAQDCDAGFASAKMEINNVDAALNTTGGLWWNGMDGSYVVPNEPNGASAIFTGGFWVGAFDPGGNLHVASQTYDYTSGDYYPGPLNADGETDAATCSNFDRFFEVFGDDISAHKNDWEDNGQIDLVVPNSILGWPGRANPFFEDVHGFEINSFNLAPFFDEDNDGIYNPMNGDRPDINLADQGIWWVFNDNGGPHNASGGVPLQMEFQVLAYSYKSPNDHINEATYYDLKMINKAHSSLDSFIFGLFLDFDLGCYTDDYIGSIPDLDMGYVYNADELDGSNGCECDYGIETYCDEAPLVGVKLLDGISNGEEDRNGMHKFMAYNAIQYQPNTPLEYYRILNSVWPDGVSLTSGGDGYDPNSTDYVDFAFPDSPDDIDGWSMCTENLIQDTRVVMATAPTNIGPSGIVALSFAVVHADDVILPCPSLDPLTDAAEDVQDHYDDISVVTSVDLVDYSLKFEVWPNPTFDRATIELGKWASEVQNIEIYSIDGKQVRTIDHDGAAAVSFETNGLHGFFIYKLNLKNGQTSLGSFVAK